MKERKSLRFRKRGERYKRHIKTHKSKKKYINAITRDKKNEKKRQTAVHKTQHRKPEIEQHESHQNPGVPKV